MGQLIEIHLSLAQQLGPPTDPDLTPEQVAAEVARRKEEARVGYAKARAMGLPVMNGRGVRIRELDADEIAEIEDLAATKATESASRVKFNNTLIRELLVAMVEEVTEPDLFDLAGAAWTKLSKKELSTGGGWGKYFGAKETEYLENIYSSYHRLNSLEVAMLSGKVRPVVTEG